MPESELAESKLAESELKDGRRCLPHPVVHAEIIFSDYYSQHERHASRMPERSFKGKSFKERSLAAATW